MARRFRFQLEVVLRLREQAKQAQRRRVAEGVREVGETQRELVELEDQRTHLDQTERAKRMSGLLDVHSLRFQQLHRGWLEREKVRLEAELNRRRAGLDQERAKLAEVTKQVDVVKKLKERRFERWCEEVQREEQRAFDEIAAGAFGRKEGSMTPLLRSGL